MSLRAFLPESHLAPESKDVIRVTIGLIATLAALVLGLLVASAKTAFDAQETGFKQLAANIVVLDRTLARYGPAAADAREALRRTVTATADSLWPATGSPTAGLASSSITAEGGKFYAAIEALAPTNDAQRTVQSQALQIATDLAHTRWLLSQEQDDASSIPFLVVLVFWLSVIFGSFGLFSPRNGAIITAFLVCALLAAGAVFLIVDLNEPSGGIIQVSSAPLRNAIAQLGQ